MRRQGPARPPFAAVLVTVFLTGAAALVYEVAWQRYLSRLFGSDTSATAVILAVFLGGLSLGYHLCGRLSVRLRRPVAACALLEAAIGLWGLAFPRLFGLVDALSANWSFAPPLLLPLQGLSCSALLLLVPTACMGGSVPLLTRGLSPDLASATSVHARIYAVNTAGAVLGTLAAGFWLVPGLGLPATVRLAAGVNLAAALGLFLLGRAARAAETAPAAAPAPPSAAPPARLLRVAFLNGFAVMILENALIRLTNLSFGSSAASFALIVAAFVLAIALGSLATARFRPPARALSANLWAALAALAALYPCLDTWPYWAHRLRILFPPTPAGYWGFQAATFLAVGLVLLLPAGLLGATVPLLFHELKRRLADVGRHSGQLLAWNTAGNLAGSLIGGVALYAVLDNPGVYLTAAAAVALAAALAGQGTRSAVSGLALAGLALVLALHPPFYDRSRFVIGTFRLPWELPFSHDSPAEFFAELAADSRALAYTDAPAGTVAVVETRRDDAVGRALMVNGKSDSSTLGDAPTIRLAAHLPALLARSRAEVLVIGLGTGVTAGELSLYPDVARLDVAEINPAVTAVLPLFDPFTHRVRLDPRLRVLHGDAFRVLARNRARYDLVVSEPSNPWVSGVDLLFTEEFYRLVRSRLNPGGLFLQWIHIRDAGPELLGLVLNTVQAVFPHRRAFQSQVNDLLILASDRALGPQDARRLAAGLTANPAVRDSLAEIGITSAKALLLREVLGPSCAPGPFRAPGPFAGQGTQTLDHPRLQTLAGRHFFLGRDVPGELLLEETAACARDFLAAGLPDWEETPGDREELERLAASATDDTRGQDERLPAEAALRLRAFRRDPDRFPLAGADLERARALGGTSWIAR